LNVQRFQKNWYPHSKKLINLSGSDQSLSAVASICLEQINQTPFFTLAIILSHEDDIFLSRTIIISFGQRLKKLSVLDHKILWMSDELNSLLLTPSTMSLQLIVLIE
jgi:hypothetical protein